jgi:hypothetical protein
MISLASLVRSREQRGPHSSRSPVHSTLELVCTCPAGPTENPHLGGAWLITASEGERENKRSLRRRPHRPITAWRMATPALRGPVSRPGVASSRAGSHSIDDHCDRTRLQEPRGQSGSRARPACAIVPNRLKPAPMPARLAALRTHQRDQSRVTPGPSCARRNRADGWRPERNTGGAERLPLFHPLSCASDVSAYAARRRLAARLSLARRGFFSPVRG